MVLPIPAQIDNVLPYITQHNLKYFNFTVKEEDVEKADTFAAAWGYKLADYWYSKALVGYIRRTYICRELY